MRWIAVIVFLGIVSGFTAVAGAQVPSSPEAGFDAGPRPEVIGRAPAGIRRRWDEVDEQLGPDDVAAKPSEERARLLIRRGRLLLAVHSRARAYKDFLRAAKVLVAVGATKYDDTGQANGWADVTFRNMLRTERYPRPLPFPSGGQLEELFGSGYHAFWDGKYERAIDYFNRAIDFTPHEPTSYYYRALAYRRLGRNPEAVQDARSGAFWEFQAIRAHWPDATTEQTYYVSKALSRVQGSSRLWLERYRAVRRSSAGTLPDVAIE